MSVWLQSTGNIYGKEVSGNERNETRQLRFKGLTTCEENVTGDDCIMLEHSVVSEQSDEAKNTIAISTSILIICKSTQKNIVKNKLQTALVKEPVT